MCEKHDILYRLKNIAKSYQMKRHDMYKLYGLLQSKFCTTVTSGQGGAWGHGGPSRPPPLVSVQSCVVYRQLSCVIKSRTS